MPEPAAAADSAAASGGATAEEGAPRAAPAVVKTERADQAKRGSGAAYRRECVLASACCQRWPGRVGPDGRLPYGGVGSDGGGGGGGGGHDDDRRSSLSEYENVIKGNKSASFHTAGNGRTKGYEELIGRSTGPTYSMMEFAMQYYRKVRAVAEFLVAFSHLYKRV